MKTQIIIVLCLVSGIYATGQSLVGTWQLTEEKTCFQIQLEESETEKELKGSMGASRNAIGRILTLDAKGKGEETIQSQGKKKGSDLAAFRYQLSGQELQFLDKKSGIITQRYLIDELSATTLRFHNALKDCETRTYIRIK